jgi:deoxyribodipyrimidine photolyase-related protein
LAILLTVPPASNQLLTVWIFGDQLNHRIGPLSELGPDQARVLLVESEAKLRSKRWHRQRLYLILSAMTHFAEELRSLGYEVDHRRAPTLAEGLRAHCDAYNVDTVRAMEPSSWDGRRLLERLGVETAPNEQFLCPQTVFAAWADGRAAPKMEDFYRAERRRLDLLMDGDEPTGGRWNFDHDNREPPPRDGRAWPEPVRFELDEIDRDVLERIDSLGIETWGQDPTGIWPVTRQQARHRLDEFLADGLAPFGAHEDAMLGQEWKLAHSVLSPALNLGLLHPDDVVRAAEDAYRRGDAPINSVEGFVRQVAGWREYVWGLYWLWMPAYRDNNGLVADRPVPPAFTGQATTDMACVANVVDKLEHYGWNHHIERLMVLGNLALTAGVDPQAMTDWMWASYVDGAEWVMVPNVVGMALHADGGRMATKPYASGGAYINRMSDHCKGCRYDPKKRTGPAACPFTTLYWDFLARHRQALSGNHRLARQLANLDRLKDLDETRQRAREVLDLLDAGRL